MVDSQRSWRPFPPGPDRKGDLISEVAHPTRNASEHASATQVPVGPWIVVVGMHRSGTSVLTGVLGGLGLSLPAPDDQWDPLPSNPEHYESMSNPSRAVGTPLPTCRRDGRHDRR
jgi:hypothetical protein